MKWLLGLLVVFIVLDGFLTRGLVSGGLAREGNPFLELLVDETGFIVIKVVGALLCAFILWDIYRHFPRVAVIAAWFLVVAYGVIVLWNSSLFMLT